MQAARHQLTARVRSALAGIGLPHLLLLALVLRLAYLPFATPAHADEVFQYLETAHRLLFGHGVVTWEWREGVRGWLLPLLVAAPMQLGGWVGGSLYLLLPKLAAIAASLVVVAVAWKLGARLSRLHGQTAGFVAAIWYELIYFAPHVLSETASLALVLPAALLLVDRPGRTARRLAVAAALLALAASIRFQLLPAIGVLVLATCARDAARCWRPLLFGGAAGVVPSILADLAMGAAPFAWMLENVRLNLLEDRASAYSTAGPLGYLSEAWPRYALWLVPLLVFAGLGARRYPALAWTALANLAFHAAIAHKEYRFILLSAVIVLILAAIGTVDWIRWLARRKGAAVARDKLMLVRIAWVAASISCALGPFRTEWRRFGPEMSLYTELRRDPSVCGVALYRHEFASTGGYAWLHRDVPMLFITEEASPRPWSDLAAEQGAVNAVMGYAAHAPEIPGAFIRSTCEGEDAARVCLYRRPGPCSSPSPVHEINAVLKAIGK